VIRKLSAAAVDAGAPLATWLSARLGLSVDEARRRVEAGAVYLDGRRVRDPAVALRAGQRIAVHETPAATRAAWTVAFEGPDAVVIDKPAGLPVAAERGGGRSLDAEVAARWPGATLLHRIDRETSGLVLFARGRDARRRLQTDLGAGRIRRLYAAVVAGEPPDALRLDAAIGPDPADPRRMRAAVPGGKPALTVARVVRRAAGRALLEVELHTGRTHQIRAHLAGAGYPILGDRAYGGPPAPRLALHARRLEWPGGHAESPVPEPLGALTGES
jgi:RluA family pseudouridine synthase